MCAVGERNSKGVRPLGRMGLRVEVSGSRWARRKGAGESLAKVWAGKVRLFWVVSEVVAVGATGFTAIELVETALDNYCGTPGNVIASLVAVIDNA